MDVHDFATKANDKLLRQYSHESRQHDKVWTIGRDSLCKAMVETCTVAMVLMVDDLCIYACGFRNLQSHRSGYIANYRYNGCIQPGVKKRFHVAAAARDQNDNALRPHFRLSVSVPRRDSGLEFSQC